MRHSESLFSIRTCCLVLMVALVGLAGCGNAASPDGDDDEYRTNESLIKNGTVDSQNTAVVGMTIRKGRGFGICTGTLIAQNLVLTARHCVSETSGGRGVRCGSSTFGSTLKPSAINVTTATNIRRAQAFYGVEKVIVGESANFCGDDIALLRLRSNVSSSVADPRAPQLGDSVNVGDDYTAIGYGTTGDNESGASGKRRKLGGQTVRCVGSRCLNIVNGEFQGSGGVCQGDSGGGAYAPDGKVFGIASRGGRNCSYSAYTSVPANAEMIRTAAQKAAADGGYSPPKWSSTGPDNDGDGIGANYDNCPDTSNPEQKDYDEDGEGDACDDDTDDDGVKDSEDNCVRTPNDRQNDRDRDGKGNPCDRDLDGDDIPDRSDICSNLKNPSQETSGNDSCKDSDGDAVADVDDNCPNTPNWEQKDEDNDGKGAACDPDEQEEMPEPDTGMGGPDAGSGSDAGSDVSIRKVPKKVEPGPGCSTTGGSTPNGSGWLLLAAAGLLVVRRRRRD